MKNVCIGLLAIFLVSCHQEPDFSKIKPGMKTDEVTAILGRPASRKPMMDSEWWLYNDPGKHMLIIRNDTVVKCTTQGDAMKVMEENLHRFDSLNKN